MQTQSSGYNHVTIWHMPFNNIHDFKLNLAQLVIILNFIADKVTQYNLLVENCYWFMHATRQVISHQVFNQDPDAFIVPHFWLWRISIHFNMAGLDLYKGSEMGPLTLTYRLCRYHAYGLDYCHPYGRYSLDFASAILHPHSPMA